MEAIIKNAQCSRDSKSIINAMGKSKKIDDDNDKPLKKKQRVASKGFKLLAHLTQGLEAKMLQTVVNHCHSKVKRVSALIFDGWTGEDIAVEELEALILRETGINMKIEKESMDEVITMLAYRAKKNRPIDCHEAAFSEWGGALLQQ